MIVLLRRARICLASLFSALCVAGHVAAGDLPPLSAREGLNWKTSAPWELPSRPDGATHIAYKDPSAVCFDGRWYIAASHVRHVGGRTRYSLVLLTLDDLGNPAAARVVPLLQSEEYAAAPSLFYFGPQKTWYLVFGWTDPSKEYHGPAFSTFYDIAHPELLSPPQRMFETVPASLPKTKNPRWLDFSVIADGGRVYLFFTDDGGNFLRSCTSVEAFPKGWSDPVAVLSGPRSVIFEGSCTYRLKDGPFLTIVEGIAPGSGNRFINALVAEDLEGPWKVVSSPEDPFAGVQNVAGASVWSDHISHGEFLRDSCDERMILDFPGSRFLYQGWDKSTRVPGVPPGRHNGYHEIPWRLATLECAINKL